MKRILVYVVFFLVTATIIIGQPKTANFVDFIKSTYSARKFVPGAISGTDLEKILNCGIKAPSARNSQMWKFMVLKETGLLKDIFRDHVEGNVCIIISGETDKGDKVAIAFDCALATQNMYLAAQALGLGSHIYTGPVAMVNGSKEKYSIPKGYEVVSLLRIGKIEPNVDAATAASKRKPYSEVVK